MAKKKKKKKKTSSGAQNQLQDLSIKELIERGERFIDAGRPRDAVSVLRFALKKHGQSPSVTHPLFRAYVSRAVQLQEKGMHAESQAVKKTAQEYLPPMADLAPGDMAAYLSCCTDREAVDLYLSYLRVQGPHPAADRILADRLVKAGGWDALTPLDDDLPLKRDSAVVRPAVDEMAEGRWEEAAAMLKPVPRTSPFAPLRLFCRGMAAFYHREDAVAAAIFARIPEDFFLWPVVRDLRTFLSGNGEAAAGEKTAALERLDCILDVPVHLPVAMREVIRHLENERVSEVRKGLQTVADGMLPSDPERALFAMLQVLWRMVLEGRLTDDAYRKLVKDLLSKERAGLLLTKVAVIDDLDHPFTTMGNYLRRIDLEFPDAGEQAMARSVILEALARLGTNDRFDRILQLDELGLIRDRGLFGIGPDTTDPEMIPIELALESVRIDPGNRTAYELLALLPRSGRAAKNAVETGLLAMMDRFPGDPYPHLELARLYYDKSAFRKAERVLHEALAQAPHDPRVVEKNALACLIAAEKNLDRDKLHLVEKDMDRAGDFDAKKLIPYILEKRMLFHLYRGESPDTFLDDLLRNRSLYEQIRTLTVLILDLDARGFQPKENHFRKVELALNRRLGDETRLTSEEASRLLMPLDQSLLRIYESRQTAPVLLSRKPDLLKRVTDADAIGLYDRILSDATMDVVKKDIKRRKKKAQKNHGVLLSFIQEVLRQIEKRDFNSGPLLKRQAEATGPLEEELRGLSRRLAPFAPQPLKEALEMFQFEILDRPSPMGGFFDDFDDFEDDDLFGDDDVPIPSFFDPNEMDQLEELVQSMERMQGNGIPLDIIPRSMIQGMVDELEDLVDELGVRNLPDGMILSMRGMMEIGGPFKRGMKLMGRFMNLAGGKPHLSREARILLYGKQKGK